MGVVRFSLNTWPAQSSIGEGRFRLCGRGVPAKGAVRWQAGDMVADRYEVVNLLGSGTFSTVLQAWDHKRQRLVALKVLHQIPHVLHYAHLELINWRRATAAVASMADPRPVIQCWNVVVYVDSACWWRQAVPFTQRLGGWGAGGSNIRALCWNTYPRACTGGRPSGGAPGGRWPRYVRWRGVCWRHW